MFIHMLYINLSVCSRDLNTSHWELKAFQYSKPTILQLGLIQRAINQAYSFSRLHGVIYSNYYLLNQYSAVHGIKQSYTEINQDVVLIIVLSLCTIMLLLS